MVKTATRLIPGMSVLSISFGHRCSQCHSSCVTVTTFPVVLPLQELFQKPHKRGNFLEVVTQNIPFFCLFVYTATVSIKCQEIVKQGHCCVPTHSDVPRGGTSAVTPRSGRQQAGLHQVPWVPSGLSPALQVCWVSSSSAYRFSLPTFSIHVCFLSPSDFAAVGPVAVPPRSGGKTASGSTRSTSGWTMI